MMEADDDNKLLRAKAVAAELGVTRHTLARITHTDPTFPPWIELSPGIRMIRRRDVREWLRRKEFEARERGSIAAPRAK